MQLAAFNAGAIVKIEGIRFRLVAERPGGGWQGLELATRCLQNWSEDELHNAYVDGRLEFENQLPAARPSTGTPLVLGDLPPTKRRRAEFRLKFLRAADARGIDFVRKSAARGSTLRKVLAEISAELGRASPLSPATYYRWRGEYQRGGVQALAGHLSQSGRPPHPAAHIIHEVIQEVIETARGAREIGSKATVTVRAVYLRAAALIDWENKRRTAAGALALPRASVSTIRRYWASYPALDRAVAEKGASNARALFRGSSVQRPFEACLDLVEYDETRLPFFFFDETSGVPLGRAWLTWYYDVYSSIPTGFYVGFEPPSDLTMASALRHACLPKGYVNDAYPTIQHRYVGGGVPRRVTYDNGLSQWSMSAERMGFDLDMIIQFATVRTPWFKPRVEGAFRRLNQVLLQEMSGFVLGKDLGRQDYDPAKHGCIGFRHFMYIFHVWLVDVYLQRPQGPFKRTPAQRWEEGTRVYKPEFVSRATDLNVLFGVRRDGARLDHRGVVFRHLRYYSEEVHDLRRRMGDKLSVSVKIDPSDLGAVHVLEPRANVWIKAHALDRAYCDGLSLHRHELNLAFAREKFDAVDMEALLKAEIGLQELIADALPQALSIRANSQIARTLGVGTQHVFDNLNHDGSLAPLTGPFTGQALNPFEPSPAVVSLLGPGSGASASPPVPTPPKARRNIPDFEADRSLRRS